MLAVEPGNRQAREDLAELRERMQEAVGAMQAAEMQAGAAGGSGVGAMGGVAGMLPPTGADGSSGAVGLSGVEAQLIGAAAAKLLEEQGQALPGDQAEELMRLLAGMTNLHKLPPQLLGRLMAQAQGLLAAGGLSGEYSAAQLEEAEVAELIEKQV